MNKTKSVGERIELSNRLFANMLSPIGLRKLNEKLNDFFEPINSVSGKKNISKGYTRFDLARIDHLKKDLYSYYEDVVKGIDIEKLSDASSFEKDCIDVKVMALYEEYGGISYMVPANFYKEDFSDVGIEFLNKIYDHPFGRPKPEPKYYYNLNTDSEPTKYLKSLIKGNGPLEEQYKLVSKSPISDDIDAED